MNLEFTIGDMLLDKSEVAALFSVAEKPALISVDITKHVDRNLIDAKKLFNLSIEQKSPQLASLAAKLAIHKPTTRRSYSRKGSSSIANQIVEPLTVDETLNTLLSARSLRYAGAASILFSCRAKGNGITLRQVAVKMVNLLDRKYKLNPESGCFRGFRQDDMGIWHTQSQEPGVPRTECYHASPMYTALRDGLAFLVKAGLVTMQEQITFGSEDKDLTDQAKLLRRKVYAVSLTQTGTQVADMWEDLTDYIANFWSSRA